MKKEKASPKTQQPESNVAQLPNAMAAEQIFLGMLMLESESWDNINHTLKPTDFYDARHRIIYEVIFHLVDKGTTIDAITVIEQLNLTRQLEEAGGQEYISELAETAVTGTDINTYGELIRDRALRRELLSAAQKIVKTVHSKQTLDTDDLLNKAESYIYRLTDDQDTIGNIQRVGSLIGSVLEKIDYFSRHSDELIGQTSGFDELDKQTAGLQPADLIVVAGRPSMGKTSFALNLAAAASVIDKHKATVFFSMEMEAEKILMRLVSMLGKAHLSKVRTGQLNNRDWLKIRQGAAMLRDAPIYLDDSSSLTPMEIRARLRRVKRRLPQGVELGLVVVDYIQLMHLFQTRENRVTEISEISRSLKAIAKEFNVPLVALSQLNRALESRPNKRPLMADLRESGAIEQDADLLLFIYRDEAYDKGSVDAGIAEINIAKQRNGPTGTIRLAFDATRSCFANLEQNTYKDVSVTS